MKVKLFWKMNPILATIRHGADDRNAKSLEDEINAWLREHPNTKIADIRQSANSSSFGPVLWMISVWYEEGDS
jgi:hypothetical protein